MAGENILQGIGDITGKLVGIFDNGLGIYKGISTRIAALKGIDGEIPSSSSVKVVAPAPAQEIPALKSALTINKVSLLLIIAGAIGAILLIIALRRK